MSAADDDLLYGIEALKLSSEETPNGRGRHANSDDEDSEDGGIEIAGVGATNAINEDGIDASTAVNKAKKKKKKRAKKSGNGSSNPGGLSNADMEAARIKIARNKHMRFISSYHGPWLQLPPEILESLLQLNCDPHALAAARAGRGGDYMADLETRDLLRYHSNHGRSWHTESGFSSSSYDVPSGLSPPPIDPAVFRGAIEIRKLVEQASDLAVRAASGLSAAALGAMATSALASNGSVAAALGLENTINGRPAAMSATRQNRLRAMAVKHLAMAYSIDEIAASVAVMQGATAIDDIAEKVLRYEPSNADAMLVGFFHEKIPSAPSIARAFAQVSPSTVLDTLIQRYPERLNYFRSLAIWQTFRQDYMGAIRTLTEGIDNAKTLRRAKVSYRRGAADRGSKGSKKRAKGKAGSGNDRLEQTESVALLRNDGAGSEADDLDANGPRTLADLDPSPACEEAADIGKEAGDDAERQLYFFRGMAHCHAASSVIEEQVLHAEGIGKPPGGLSNETGELTLANIGVTLDARVHGHARGTLVGIAEQPHQQDKMDRYRAALGSESANTPARTEILELLDRSTRDFETFLSYFAVWEGPNSKASHAHTHASSGQDATEDTTTGDLGAENGQLARARDLPPVVNQHLVRSQTEKSVPFGGRKLVHHRALTGRTRYGDPRTSQTVPRLLPLVTTYHPLMIESHFSMLLNYLLLGDFCGLLRHHYRTARLMDSLEGYPVFVPARSLNQSQYAEVMELLSCSWLPAREASGISLPTLGTPEDEMYALGPLTCLHHLVSFFSDEHNKRLEEAAVQAERDAAAQTVAAIRARRPAALAKLYSKDSGATGPSSSANERRKLVEKRILEESEREIRELEKEQETLLARFKQNQKLLLDGPAHNTARAEVALAWLMIAILPDLERKEEEEKTGKASEASLDMAAPRSASPSGSSTTPIPPLAKGKGKGKAPESSVPFSLARPASAMASGTPGTIPAVKGKGKGRALKAEDSLSSVGSSSSAATW